MTEVLFKPNVMTSGSSKNTGLLHFKPVKNIFNISFEEEKQINDPSVSLEWVLNKYRESFKDENGHGLYEWEPITFSNTTVVSTAAAHFKKYKRYNDIEESSRHWKLWWDREEYRRKYGVTVPIKSPPGGGLSDKDLLPVWIPGVYYGHLNYGPIKRTIDPGEAAVKKVLGNSVESQEELEKFNRLKNMYAGLSNKVVAKKDYDFPDFWDGHYHTYLASEVAASLGLDIGLLKGRRKGFSYIGAWQAFNTYDLIPASLVLLIAHDMKFLNKGKEALFNMVKSYSDFINSTCRATCIIVCSN